MNRSEIEQVLANWIEQATSGEGRLVEGTDPAKWIAAKFLRWWHPRVDGALSDAEGAVQRLRAELERLGGWENQGLGEALHELIHLGDALADLRAALDLHNDDSTQQSFCP